MALEHAYDHREKRVEPRTVSSSSRKGTDSLLPYTSLVEASSTGFRNLFAVASTTSVPWMFVSIVCTGRSTMSCTPTAAAR